ncbi:PaaR repeat-containing protein [Ralstonia phage RP13]|nr:PaaR repeat-containing protein [Ralstonia phage RP13]
MTGIVRKTDLSTGYTGKNEQNQIVPLGPRPATSGSQSVMMNGVPIVRVGDSWDVHPGGNGRPGVQQTGSPNIFVEGKAVARQGDTILDTNGQIDTNNVGSSNFTANS